MRFSMPIVTTRQINDLKHVHHLSLRVVQISLDDYILTSCSLAAINFDIQQGRRNGFVIGGQKKICTFWNYTSISKGYDFLH